VSVSVKLELLPTCTFPNPRLVGFDVSAPCATPVPERGMLKLEFDPLEVIVRLPLTLPGEVGENVTLKLTPWPALRVTGKLRPLTLYPEILKLAAEIMTLAPPELVTVSVNV